MQSAANSYYYVEVDRGVGTRDNEGGMRGESRRRRSGMWQSCEGEGWRRMRDIKFFNDFLVPF